MVLVAVVAPFVYIHFIEGSPPPKLDVSSATTEPSTGASAPLDGRWKAGSGSSAGYRVDEVLFGQNNTAVGRTKDVTGSITIAGTAVTSGTVKVDLTTVTSDEARRDAQFQGRIMDTASFPDATFELTEPIQLGTVPADNQEITARATGKLTLHGTTKTVTTDVKARRTGNTIQVSGSIPITFADYGIPNPSFATITTKDHGELEFLVAFVPA